MMYQLFVDYLALVAVVVGCLYLGYAFGYHSALYDLKHKKSHSIKG